jgi:hypothetical protein
MRRTLLILWETTNLRRVPSKNPNSWDLGPLVPAAGKAFLDTLAYRLPDDVIRHIREFSIKLCSLIIL